MKKMLGALLALTLTMWSASAMCQQINKAVKDNNLPEVRQLLKNDPSLVSSRDENGFTPLHLAAANGYKSMVEFQDPVESRTMALAVEGVRGWPTFTFFVKVGTLRSDVTAFSLGGWPTFTFLRVLRNWGECYFLVIGLGAVQLNFFLSSRIDFEEIKIPRVGQPASYGNLGHRALDMSIRRVEVFSVTNEQGVESANAHPSKTATDGAAIVQL